MIPVSSDYRVPLVYRLADRLRGWKVFDRLNDLREMEAWSATELRRWQDGRVKALLAHTQAQVAFYRDHWRRHGIDPASIGRVQDLRHLPETTKSMLVTAGDATLDPSIQRASMIVGRSSGSTGTRFVYYKSRAHQGWWLAGNFLGWEWAGWRPGDRWVRLQFRGPLNVVQKLEDRTFRCMNVPIDRFDDQFMRTSAGRIARFEPVLLRGYAGATYVFAKWLLEHDERRVRPQVVVVTGDTLYPHYREAIEAAFRAPLYDTYGGEGMTVANQCAEGRYHILPTVHVDLAPYGSGGSESYHRLILTSLTNTAMPMIRYDIGDVAVPAKGECGCGRHWPALERIVGRETDIVVTPSGRRLVVHHFNNVIRAYDGIDQFQVVQAETGALTLKLVTNPRYSAQDEERLRAQLRDLVGERCRIEIELCSTIPAPPTGKRRYVISHAVASRAQAEPSPS